MKAIYLLSLVMLLGGCNNGLEDINEFMERHKNIPVPQIDPLPQLKPHEVFEYNANGFRDPFSNDLEEQDDSESNETSSFAETGKGPDLTRRKEFLESYPLDSLLMVGTYEQEGNYWGLVVDPDGTIHRVSVGHYLGHNHGVVSEIYENEIKIIEWLNDGLGAWREREAAMALKEE
ncbi:pilus assembly protein PilP [Marinicella litoralis]|uniref:Type IV pilus assembly protein PilP n=1 Tax=Marinicella litoralis TaxID=644220 RepID=A0A4R6XRD1_9GAMM|nr:pilus assembly protein PilP [Marinicella litoralis]TDR22442.1 type IV pilus assembly protein PilP [Marinicella litoralis]